MPQTTEHATGSGSFRDLFPFTSHFHPVGRYKLHYVDEGKGPVLLLMHACPLWSFSYRGLIREFSKTCRVIALDQMGFGLSDKPEHFDYRLENHVEMLESFIHSLDLHNITLIMHGRGSTVGMAYAARNPENIHAFITMNAMAFSDFSLPWRLQLCRIKWLGAGIILNMDFFTRGARKLPPDISACYKMPYPDKASKQALIRFIEDIPSAPEDDSAQSMLETEASLWMLRNKPCAILWAGKDWLYTKKSLAKWKQYFPDAEFHFFKKAGRYLPEEATAEIIAIIHEFLRRYPC